MKRSAITDQGVMAIHLGGAVLCALLLGAGWFIGLSPMLSESHQNTSLIEQSEKMQHESLLSKVRLDELNTKLADVQKQLEHQPVNLEFSSEINPLLSRLALWADQHRLAVTRTRAGRPVVLAYYDYVPISFAGEGSFTDLLAFFDRLREDRSDLGIISFNASRRANGASVRFEVELAWYVISDDADASKPVTASVPTP